MIELQPDGVVFVRTFLAVTAGILVLFIGKGINARVRLLGEFNIPEPVTGGLLFAAATLLLYGFTGYRVTFELGVRDVLLVYFFTTIGINARLSDLRAGGRPLAILLLCVGVYLVFQDVAGIAIATAMGHPAALGLLAGSVSMLGGHGTAIAWAPTFAAKGIDSALEIGTLCATAGLVFASVTGGPVARFLVRRHGLEGPAEELPAVGLHYGERQPAVDYFSFLRAVLGIHICGFVGMLTYQALGRTGVNLPLFVPCLVAGILFTNLLPRVAPGIAWPDHTPALSLIAELSLGVFLAMSLMSMQLWALAGLAGPLLVLVGLQVVAIVLFAIAVLFRLLGSNYDSAVICGGFIGFGLGATPTAMANMTAITQRHGASRVAFLVVPLVGAFFIDLMNAVVIRLFVEWL